MVTSGTFYNGSCCFDYGTPRRTTTMMARAPWRLSILATGRLRERGAGNGPWVMADMENGVYAQASFCREPQRSATHVPVCNGDGDREIRVVRAHGR